MVISQELIKNIKKLLIINIINIIWLYHGCFIKKKLENDIEKEGTKKEEKQNEITAKNNKDVKLENINKNNILKEITSMIELSTSEI